MGQDDALLAPDWSDVTPGDLNGTEVSSTSHVYIPGPRYNQSKIHSIGELNQSEAIIGLA